MRYQTHRLLKRSLVIWLLLLPNAVFAADLATAEEAAMQEAIKSISDSVVRIETIGGLEKVDKLLVSTAPTTGLIVSEDGYIVSSAFNFIQKPSSILVTFPDGESKAAEIVAKDHSRHIVLLKAETKSKLAVPTPTPKDEVRVGYWSLAIGRAIESDSPNISVGIVSAVNRIWGRAIQTDSKVSPLNYGGPLIDIQGRVLGVLVPLSPQDDSAVAGAEWYDSGIGFAVPLDDVFAVLDKLKEGEDLHRGLLGITVKGKNSMADPAIIAHAMPGTPAAKAGLKSGDHIIEVNGTKIGRHDDLKIAIGRQYAGEVVELLAMRGDEELKLKITLTDHIDPYQLPFLGVLPRRDSKKGSPLEVRFVYPDSPAATAGLEPDDELLKIDGEKVESLEDWYAEIADREPKTTVEITYLRDEKTKSVPVELTVQPESLPGELPAAHEQPAPKEAAAGSGLVEIKLPEESNKCFAYVPEDYDANVAHGVVIYLAAPGEFEKESLIASWQEACEQHDLIMLAPQPADKDRWEPTEVDFVRKTFDDLARNYNVDEHRVVVHGHQAGGSLGYRFAFANRDIVRGIAAVDATVPAKTQARGNEPQERMSIYVAYNEDSKLAKRIVDNVKKFRDFKFPVTVVEQPSDGYLIKKDLADLARWIDSLDRL